MRSKGESPAYAASRRKQTVDLKGGSCSDWLVISVRRICGSGRIRGHKTEGAGYGRGQKKQKRQSRRGLALAGGEELRAKVPGTDYITSDGAGKCKADLLNKGSKHVQTGCQDVVT